MFHMKHVDLKAILKARGMNLSQAAVLMGIDKSTMTRWAQDRVPGELVPKFEEKTGIPRYEVRPDLFGPAPAPQEVGG